MATRRVHKSTSMEMVLARTNTSASSLPSILRGSCDALLQCSFWQKVTLTLPNQTGNIAWHNAHLVLYCMGSSKVPVAVYTSETAAYALADTVAPYKHLVDSTI